MTLMEEPIARLMLRALRRFEDELQSKLHNDGYEDVSVALTNVLRHLDRDGMKLTELAKDAGISKQAASQAVKALVARDLVSVADDGSDGRARRVVYTERGNALVASAIKHVYELEQRWQTELGTADYQTLRKVLMFLSRVAE